MARTSLPQARSLWAGGVRPLPWAASTAWLVRRLP